LSTLTKTLLMQVETIMNADPFVTLNIKRARLTLELICGSDEFAFAIEDGILRLLRENETTPGPRVTIAGSADNWVKIIDGLHGGLHRAFRHKLLRFDGDAASMLTIWKTNWRLGEALAEAGKGGR